MILAQAAMATTPLINAMTPAQMQLPTPCEGRSVGDTVAHLVTALQQVSSVGRGEDPSTWPQPLSGLADDQWAKEWTEAGFAVRAAWTDESTLSRQAVLPFGTMTGAEALGIYTNEIVVHAWDLAKGMGMPVVFSDAVVGAAMAAIKSQMPVADRTEMWAGMEASMPAGVTWQVPFANAVDVAPDAPMIDQLVAWNGRKP
jgi:uncharacterized protein (TIGR03086 family)